MIGGEVLFLTGLFWVNVRIVRSHRIQFLDRKSFRAMLAFGGLLIVQKMALWITFNIHSIIIGSLLSVGAVTYFNIPYSLTCKVGILGACIAPVVFPALSLLRNTDREKMLRLFSQALKYTVILYGLPSLIIIVFAKQIIVLWLGDSFRQSIVVMQLLTIGVFLGGISWIFSILMQIISPRFITVVTLCQAPLYTLLTWYLTKTCGIVGAACAWCSLVASSTLVLYVYLAKTNYVAVKLTLKSSHAKGLLGVILVLCVNVVIEACFAGSVGPTVINALILVIGYTVLAWHYFVDDEYKIGIKSRIGHVMV
jgi:O-antigen/teichoic acid export membrane protein